MPQRITVHAAVDAFRGYGLHLIEIVRGLRDRGLYPSIRPLQVQHGRGATDIPIDIRALIVNGRQPEEWELLLAPAHNLPTPGKRTAYFTMCESTVLPRQTVELLNHAAVVIVPSQWCATVFSANGVTSPIRVVPLGVNLQTFSFQPPRRGNCVVFGAAGCLRHGFHRKGLQRIIDLFQRAFPGPEDVCLRVKCQRDDPPLSAIDPRIEVVHTFLPEPNLAAWYRSLTAFINIATGGWEMMPHQAMATGRPIIGPCYGGMAEFHNSFTGFVVPHRFAPALDAWKGLGMWADIDEDAMIDTLRAVYRDPEMAYRRGVVASQSAALLSWDNANDKLVEVLSEFGACDKPARKADTPIQTTEKPVSKPPAPMNPDTLVIGITNFKRAWHLERAIISAQAFPTVVSAMEPDAEVDAVLRKYSVRTIRNIDLGCHASWERAAYYADSEYVLILHDDDALKPEFAAEWKETILPALKRGLAVTWRAEHLWNDGRVTATEYFHGPTRELPKSDLIEFLLRSQLSLSPIVTVFRRSVLIEALKEAAECLTDPDCQHRQGMLLGTEVLAHLRHAQASNGWLYLDKVLSQYGAHDGSGTMQMERSGDLAPLIRGYDVTRAHWLANPEPPPTKQRVLLVFSDYTPKDDDECTRFDQALRTWQFHVEQGELMPFPIRDNELPRCADVPYVRDLFDHGCRFAGENDIVVLINRDVCLTTQAIEHIRRGIDKTRGLIACPRRDMNPIVTGRLHRSVLNCKPDGGFDVFAVTPKWWRENREEFPDMFLGREAWDTVLRRMGEEQFGKVVYVDDVCYHRAHLSRWQQARTQLPSQIHNRKVALEFFSKRKDPWMIKQLS